MIALMCALKEEASRLLRLMSLERVLSESACQIYRGTYRCRDILLAQTGIGQQRAEMATRFVLENYPITILVSFGFAGALVDELEAGDIVICSTLHNAQTVATEATKPISYCCDDGLLLAAMQALEGTIVRFYQGSGVTVPQLVLDPQEKGLLGETFSALVVDMESYWIAGIATDKQIPFIAIRSISDTRREKLPPFTKMLTADGQVQWKNAISYFAVRPQRLKALFQLYRNMRRATSSIVTSIDTFMAGL